MKKLAEMSTVELATTLCLIAEPAGNIFSDDMVCQAFKDFGSAYEEQAGVIKNMAVFASKVVPALLGDAHRDDTLRILAALSGKTAEELKIQSGMETMKELFAMLTRDRDLTEFFRSGTEKES